MDIAVRPMKTGDYNAVLRLWKRCFKGIYPQDRREAVKKTLKKNPGSSFVALSGSRIIGSIIETNDTRFGYLHRLAVDPDFRGIGIGSKLMKEAEKALKKQDVKKIIFFCLNEKKLVNYYEKQGYRKSSYCLMTKEIV